MLSFHICSRYCHRDERLQKKGEVVHAFMNGRGSGPRIGPCIRMRSMQQKKVRILDQKKTKLTRKKPSTIFWFLPAMGLIYATVGKEMQFRVFIRVATLFVSH